MTGGETSDSIQSSYERKFSHKSRWRQRHFALTKLSIRPSSPGSRLNVCLRPGDTDHRTPSPRIEVVAVAHICVYGTKRFAMTGVAELKQRANAERMSAQVSTARYSISPAISRPVRVVVPIRANMVPTKGMIERCRDFAAPHALFLLRLSLASVFFWFGVLKVANVSPAVVLLRAAIPFLTGSPYLQILGIVEIAIGAGLLVDRLARQANALMILHLLGTLSLIAIVPSLLFAPAFPVLTMAGEFVLKNVVLITSAVVILLSRPQHG